MRKPNYNMERKDRERAKQAKAAAKLERRAAKGTEHEPADAPMTGDTASLGEATRPKSDN
jgi:hypothetical protein